MTPHPYLEGYSTLPKLKKITSPLFVPGNLRTQKEQALKSQYCFLEHEITPDIYQPVCDFIVQNHPDSLSPNTFPNLALQITEDLAIHRLDWLAATHVCFPSGWRPEEKIGKSFLEIHQPIPGMNLNNSRKLVEASIFNGPFERYVWGLTYDNEYNGHPQVFHPEFDLANPVLYVKVETQLMIGFPEIEALLFVLRQVRIPESEIEKPALLAALKQMTTAQKAYKGIPENVIHYLERN